MPSGIRLTAIAPGQHQKYDLAGALNLATGMLLHYVGPRQTPALFRDLLTVLDECDTAEPHTRFYRVVDHDKIHTAKAVAHWLAAPLRVPPLLLPTDCPCANPVERAFGDIHGCYPRNDQRKW